jgi:hypothetical protein
MALFTRSRLNATGCTNPNCKDPDCKTRRELVLRNTCHDDAGFHVEYDKECGHLHLSCYKCGNPIVGIMVGEEFACN